jgi:polyisoprenoid-binding protein YceI
VWTLDLPKAIAGPVAAAAVRAPCYVVGMRTSPRPVRHRAAALLVVLLVAGGAVAKTRPAAVGAAATPPPRGLVYTVDDAHSFVEFSVRLLGFNRVRGTFPDYTAHIYYDPDSVGNSSVSVRMAVAGVSTHESERDHHLESPDFFDAARFPFMHFDSRAIEPAPLAAGFVAVGELTIRDVTRRVAIPFTITAPLGVDPFGNTRFSVAGRVTISRRDFGVIGPKFWNNAIGDSVEIEFEVGARRWNYDNLGWGDPPRTSIGQRILATADSLGLARALRDSRDLWAKQRANPAWNFGLFEYMKCAGRLGQRNRPGDGAAVLGQAIELQADSTAAAALAAVRCQRAELLMRAGDVRGAREELDRAQAADSTSTYARALRRMIG